MFEFEKRGEAVPRRGVDDKMEKGMQLTLFTSDERHGGQLLRLADVDAATWIVDGWWLKVRGKEERNRRLSTKASQTLLQKISL